MVARNLGKMGRKGVTLNPGHFTQLGESRRSLSRGRELNDDELTRLFFVLLRRRVRSGTWTRCSLHSSNAQHSRTRVDQGSS